MSYNNNNNNGRAKDGSFASVDLRRAEGSRAYQPKELSARHHEILRMLLCGLSHVDIAEALQVTPATVSNVANSDLGKMKLQKMCESKDYNAMDINRRIQEATYKAVEVMEDLLQSESAMASVKLRCAESILDRAGHSAIKRVSINSTNVQLTSEDMQAIRDEALARAQQNGLLIDVQASSCEKVEDRSNSDLSFSALEIEE